MNIDSVTMKVLSQRLGTNQHMLINLMNRLTPDEQHKVLKDAGLEPRMAGIQQITARTEPNNKQPRSRYDQEKATQT